MTLPEAVHFIGIGGTGLSAMARVLLERGCRVSGSDRQLSPLADSLQKAGVRILIGHRAENVQGAELVVRSSAISDDNVEVQAAIAAGIPVLKRREFLAQLIAEQRCLAVAGSHGKTTTTAMLAWVLTALLQDPSYMIGGVSTNLAGNAHAGKGLYFVIEADEYDYMFLGLQPYLAIVTNIEHDHPDCFPTPEDFYQAFEQFTRQVLPGGTLLINADDPGSRRILHELQARGLKVFSYGIQVEETTRPDYQAQNLHVNEVGGMSWEAVYTCADGTTLRQGVSMLVPGEHNVVNALAVLAAAHQLGLSFESTALALSEYQGTGRRFEVVGEAQDVVVIDDYAHHPTQIRTTLAAARQRYPGRRLCAVWQPHTYSRTRSLAADFAQSFVLADLVVVSDVYASREKRPADGFGVENVMALMQHPEKHSIPGLEAITQFLLETLRAGDVLLVFSAGDADQISQNVLQALHGMEASHA